MSAKRVVYHNGKQLGIYPTRSLALGLLWRMRKLHPGVTFTLERVS